MSVRKLRLGGGAFAVGLAVVAVRGADITPELRPWLKSFHEHVEQKPGERQSRELTYAALVVLTAGDDPKVAQDYLRRAYNTQDMDRSKKTYGQLRWLVGDPSPITDFNSIEFNSVPLGALLNGYGEKLSPEFNEYMKPHVSASLDALRAHDVKVSYTNICLMNAESLILLGQLVKDDSARDEGNKRLDAWIAYTKQNGIHEFDSPTYYGVDLYGLMKAYRFVADPATRAKFKTILNYFWSDVAANYFAPGQRMAGPYARDYDFLAGTGQLDDWLRSVGWVPGTPPPTVSIVDNFGGSVYQLPTSAVELAHRGPRMVVSTWDDNPGHLRFAWLGKSVTLGCTSGNYEPQDKLFAATFAGPREMPQISLVVDTFDAPYGLEKRKDRTNHSKPWHQDANFGSVQNGGTALTTLDIDPSQTPADEKGLATNLVLPANTSITVDGVPADLSSPRQIDVKPGSIVTSAIAGAAFAVRFIKIESLDGHEPSLTLCADESGLAHHAVRLKIAHLAAGQGTASRHLRIVLLATVADSDQPTELGERLQHTVVHSETANGVWRITAESPDLSLEVDRSANDPHIVFPPRVNGVEVRRTVLTVDNTDLAARIWDPNWRW